MRIIIIGAGPGGYETALEAAARGHEVTLFNGGALGGTCLNEGCIPTKCLCRNAEMVSSFKEADKFGIDDFTFSLDFNKVMERKREVVESLCSGVDSLLKGAKVNVVNEKASFKDSHTVTASGVDYVADYIIIATGSSSKSLPIDGASLECVKSSKELLDINYIPESLTIIGGGVIGMEFAGIFASFGTRVTVIEFMKQILPPFDSDIAKRLKQALSKKGIEIITGAAAKKIDQNEEHEVVVTYEVKGKVETVVSSDLLMAVGRMPYTDGLNLEACGVEYGPKGIPVDDFMRTNVENIFAIGDVNARMMLAHVASFQGKRALNAIDSIEDGIRLDIVPSAVFTVPECGMAGLTEEACKTQGVEVVKGTSFFRANGKALALGEPEGICKLLFRKADLALVGAHIMGAGAADLAQQCADMMNVGMTLPRIKDVVFGHPTLSEVILSACHNVKLKN